jgi:hypothetical protein
LKIRRDVTTRVVGDAGSGGRNTWTEMIWFAPVAKSAVKFTTNNMGGTDWELVSYSVK